MKTYIQNALLLSASLLVALLVAEGGVRFIYGAPIHWQEPQVKHVIVGKSYKPAPSQLSFTGDMKVTTNAHGFRADEWQVPKPEGVTRIMIVGDSITFGNVAAQEAIYPNLLRKTFSDKSSGQVEVLNVSAGGWNSDTERAYLEAEGMSFEPDLVIVAFYLNDYGKSKKVAELTSQGRVDERPAYLRWIPYSAVYALKRSALISFMRPRLTGLLTLFRQRGTGMKRSFRSELLDGQIDLDTHPATQATYDDLRAIHDLCKEKGAGLMIVHLPSLDLLWREQGSVPFVNHLASFAHLENIIFSDLTDSFRAAGDLESLYRYPWDNHLSGQGHALAAAVLAPLIEGWLANEGRIGQADQNTQTRQ